MQTLEDLNANFAVPGALSFVEGQGRQACAEITLDACRARVYLQGAHLAHWQPVGEEPVFFISEKSVFAPGKVIRGGVPIIFPWFGDRSKEITGDSTDGPAHGFARLETWDVMFAAVVGDDLRLTLSLSPTEHSRAFGFDNFRVAYEVTLGRTLSMRLSVVNLGEAPLCFEEALHSYFAVSDVEQVFLDGLAGTEFLDKTDGFRRKKQQEETLRLTGEIDRPYLNTEATVRLTDPAAKRTIVIGNKGSKTTVVWNPWSTKGDALKDMGAGDWRGMACVETANVADNRITLLPRESHAMEATISVENVSAEAVS